MSHTPEFKFDATRNGVHAAPFSLAGLRARAVVQDIAWCELDLDGVTTKKKFLDYCARALKFPAGFGGNWDALADSLEDLSWQPATGVVVHWRNGAAFAKHTDEHSAALEIFTAAARYWKQRSRLFLVLVDEGGQGGQLLPALPQQ